MHSREKIPIELQWVITLSEIISVGFLYFWLFLIIIFIFAPFSCQASNEHSSFSAYCFSFWILFIALPCKFVVFLIQSSRSKSAFLLKSYFVFPPAVRFYVMKRHFCTGSLIKQVKFVLLFITPSALTLSIAILVAYSIYPSYNKQDASGKLLIAVFSTLIAFILKGVCRICMQRLWCQISHPETSFVLLSPMYCGSARDFYKPICRVWSPLP